MLDPSEKSNVPTDRQVRVSKTCRGGWRGSKVDSFADPVRVTLMMLPSCVSNGAPGGEKTPAARAAPPPTKTEPANRPIPRRHCQRRRQQGARSTLRDQGLAQCRGESRVHLPGGHREHLLRYVVSFSGLRGFQCRSRSKLGHDESASRAAPSEMPRAVAAWAGEYCSNTVSVMRAASDFASELSACRNCSAATTSSMCSRATSTAPRAIGQSARPRVDQRSIASQATGMITRKVGRGDQEPRQHGSVDDSYRLPSTPEARGMRRP